MFAAMYNVLIWAQVNRGNQPPFGQPAGGVTQAQADGIMATIASLGIVFTIFELLLVALVLGGMWKVFTKAGEPGWAAIVPIYNVMILGKICGRGELFGLLMLIPCVGIIISIMLSLDLAKAFGKGGGYGVGLWLLPFVFYPMLGFGSAEFVGAEGESRGRRRRRRDEDDDEEEEEERPRRVASKDPGIQKRPSAPPPPAPKLRPPVEDDDDEEEERPRPRKR